MKKGHIAVAAVVVLALATYVYLGSPFSPWSCVGERGNIGGPPRIDRPHCCLGLTLKPPVASDGQIALGGGYCVRPDCTVTSGKGDDILRCPGKPDRPMHDL